VIFEAEGVVALVLLAFWIYCIFDVIGTDASVCRNLPKGVWIMLVLFLADIGAIAWLIMGRPQHTTWQPGSSAYRSAPRGIDAEERDYERRVNYDSLSDVVREREDLARMRMREEQLRRREEELRAKEEEFRRRVDGD